MFTVSYFSPTLVKQKILSKPISEFSETDIGTIVYIPYKDTTRKYHIK